MVFPRNIVVALTLVIALASTPLVYHYSKGNLTADPLPPEAKTDAVMVFTGSTDRLVQGYEFYLKGITDKLMFTGFDYATESKQPEVRKLSRKVDKSDVFVDLKAKNTIENAQNGAQWAIKNHVKSILLVTTEGHMPRAYFELRRLLPENVKVYTDSVPGTVHHSGLDTEEGRFLCRLYETATHTSFCYKTRAMARNLGL